MGNVDIKSSNYDDHLTMVGKSLEKIEGNIGNLDEIFKGHIFVKINNKNEVKVKIYSNAFKAIIAFLSSKLLPSKKNYVDIKFGDTARTYVLTKMKNEFEELGILFKKFKNLEENKLNPEKLKIYKDTLINIESKMEKINQSTSRIFKENSKLWNAQNENPADVEGQLEGTSYKQLFSKREWTTAKFNLESKIKRYETLQQNLQALGDRPLKTPKDDKDLSQFFDSIKEESRWLKEISTEIHTLFSDEDIKRYQPTIQKHQERVEQHVTTQLQKLAQNLRTSIDQTDFTPASLKKRLDEDQIPLQHMHQLAADLEQNLPVVAQKLRETRQTVIQHLSEKVSGAEQKFQQNLKENATAMQDQIHTQKENLITKQKSEKSRLESQMLALTRLNIPPGAKGEELKATIQLLVKVMQSQLMQSAGGDHRHQMEQEIQELANRLGLIRDPLNPQNFIIDLNIQTHTLMKTIYKDIGYQNLQRDVSDYEKKAHAPPVSSLKQELRETEEGWRNAVKNFTENELSRLDRPSPSTIPTEKAMVERQKQMFNSLLQTLGQGKKIDLDQTITLLYTIGYTEGEDQAKELMTRFLTILGHHQRGKEKLGILKQEADKEYGAYDVLKKYADYTANELPQTIKQAIPREALAKDYAKTSEELGKELRSHTILKQMTTSHKKSSLDTLPTQEEVDRYIQQAKNPGEQELARLFKGSLAIFNERRQHEENLTKLQTWDEINQSLAKGAQALKDSITITTTSDFASDIGNTKVSLQNQSKDIQSQISEIQLLMQEVQALS